MSDRVFDEDFKYALYVRWRAQQMFVAAQAFIEGWKAGDPRSSFESIAKRLGLSGPEAAKQMMLFEPKKNELKDAWVLPALIEAMDVHIQLGITRLDAGDGGWFKEGAGI